MKWHHHPERLFALEIFVDSSTYLIYRRKRGCGYGGAAIVTSGAFFYYKEKKKKTDANFLEDEKWRE